MLLVCVCVRACARTWTGTLSVFVMIIFKYNLIKQLYFLQRTSELGDERRVKSITTDLKKFISKCRLVLCYDILMFCCIIIMDEFSIKISTRFPLLLSVKKNSIILREKKTPQGSI